MPPRPEPASPPVNPSRDVGCFTSRKLGDSLILMVSAENLRRSGRAVTVYSDRLDDDTSDDLAELLGLSASSSNFTMHATPSTLPLCGPALSLSRSLSRAPSVSRSLSPRLFRCLTNSLLITRSLNLSRSPQPLSLSRAFA